MCVEFAPFVELAINTNTSKSTGGTPYYLVFGQSPMVPNDYLDGIRNA